jgi:hypothetical protein
MPPGSPPSTDALPGPPPGRDILDSGLPNVARIYDCLIGGKDNFAADRQAARELAAAIPGIAQAARDNRAFLGRAVRFLAGQAGITQFLDIGTGLPTRSHVHQIAQKISPAARVAYADNDPIVIAHARALLAGQPGTTAVHADLRYPRDLLTNTEIRRLIDFSKPAAILLVAVLHFVPDDQHPWSTVRCLTEHLAPGSYLVISHVTGDEITPGAVHRAREVYAGTLVPGVARSHTEIARFFDGTSLVSPGLVDVSRWRTTPRAIDRPVLCYAGIGRKPYPAVP